MSFINVRDLVQLKDYKRFKKRFLMAILNELNKNSIFELDDNLILFCKDNNV